MLSDKCDILLIFSPIDNDQNKEEVVATDAELTKHQASEE